MPECPDCGRWNVPAPQGHEAFCGRRVQFNDVSEDWHQRMRQAIICREKSHQRERDATDVR